MKKYHVLLIIFLVILGVLLGVAVLRDGSLKPKQVEKSRLGAGSTRIVMLGDSLTFRADWKLLLKSLNVVNRGVDGNTTRDILRRLNGVIGLQPDICCIMAGINDISRGGQIEEIFENYRLIMEKLIESDIRPVIQSTLYVTGFFFESEDINGMVRRLNQKLKEYADKKEILFINLNRSMSDRHGLIPEYAVDGVHLSRKGYEAWSRILISRINSLDSKKQDLDSE